MQLGVVSDTHGHVGFTREAIRVLESFEVNEVLHCGDIGSPDVVALFSAWPTHFVLGNVDYDAEPLRRAIADHRQHCHDRFGSLTREEVRIALLHGDDQAALDEAIYGGRFDLVCHGHTHVADTRTEGDTLVVNPGALYRASPHSLAVVELPSLNVNRIPLT